MVIVSLTLLMLGFMGGLIFQHYRTGYHYKVKETKEYHSPNGPVQWSYVTESVGSPFLDPGTTILEVDGRTIYKAERVFQESSPYARNIIIDEDEIKWDDGDYQYNLTIKKEKTGE